MQYISKKVTILFPTLVLCMFIWHGCGDSTTNHSNSEKSTAPKEAGSNDGGTGVTPDTTSNNSPDSKTANVTWYKDVFPIIQKHCQGCHREGGIAPFKLTTYEDVKAKAKVVEWSITSKRMPPWMPADDCQPIKHPRKLEDKEIQTISSWVNGGTPLGNESDAPKTESKTDQLEWVDKEVAPTKAYTPRKKGDSDDYHCLIVDPDLKEDKTLIGYEVVPGAKDLVHHVIIYPVNLSQARAKETSPGSGYTCYGGPGVKAPNGANRMLGGWVPGTTIVEFPKDTGMTLPKGSGLVMQIHYNFAKANPQADLTKLRLQFARKPVSKKLLILAVRDGNLSIPPNSKDHLEDGGQFRIKKAGRLWGVLPHMHALGSSIRVDVQAGGNKTCLVNIPKWDFNWQQAYFFNRTEGIPVKPGDVIKLQCRFNNPTDKVVKWGESTNEEMCLNYFYATVDP